MFREAAFRRSRWKKSAEGTRFQMIEGKNAAKKEFRGRKINITAANGAREEPRRRNITNNVKYKNIWKTRSRVFLWSHFWATPMNEKNERRQRRRQRQAKKCLFLKLRFPNLPNFVKETRKKGRKQLTFNLFFSELFLSSVKKAWEILREDEINNCDLVSLLRIARFVSRTIPRQSF